MNNFIFTAMLAAILAATQGITVMLRNWLDELNLSFAILCTTVFFGNVGLTMAALTGSRSWYVLSLVASIAAGPAAVVFFQRLLGVQSPRGAWVRPLMTPIGLALTLLAIIAFDVPKVPIRLEGSAQEIGKGLIRELTQQPATHGIALLCGLYIFTCFWYTLRSVLDRRKNSKSRLERARLTWLASFGAATILTNFLQSAGPYVDLPGSSLPLGALAQLLIIAFLGQVIRLYRLLDLHEIIGRGLIFLSQALVIGIVYSGLLALFGDAKSYVNLAITILLVSGVVSLLHDPMKRAIQRLVQRLFVRRRYELMARLSELERTLPRILSVEALFDALMEGLAELPRITHAAIFQWDEGRKGYACHRCSGPEGWPPPHVVAPSSPFCQELMSRAKPFGHEDLMWEIESGFGPRPEVPAALATLKRLDAEVAVPFLADGLLFGFLLLKDDSMLEGFNYDELELLQRLADSASVILQNTDAIQRMKERDRLAAIGQMAAGLAHEIRNPLGAIRGAAQYLADGDSDAVDEEFLEVIVEEVDRLNKVVTEFLDYSRPLKPRLEPWDINHLVKQTVALLRAEGGHEALNVVLELAPDLPPAPIDVEKMKQVLLNLLHNAVHAMNGAGTLTLRTGLAPRTWVGARWREATLDRLEIQVSDTGDGISQENLEKLFIPFFTTRPGGTGLGLAISQRLLQAQHGELEVESSPGEGSTFTIRLPVHQVGSLLTNSAGRLSSKGSEPDEFIRA